MTPRKIVERRVASPNAQHRDYPQEGEVTNCVAPLELRIVRCCGPRFEFQVVMRCPVCTQRAAMLPMGNLRPLESRGVIPESLDPELYTDDDEAQSYGV